MVVHLMIQHLFISICILGVTWTTTFRQGGHRPLVWVKCIHVLLPIAVVARVMTRSIMKMTPTAIATGHARAFSPWLVILPTSLPFLLPFTFFVSWSPLDNNNLLEVDLYWSFLCFPLWPLDMVGLLDSFFLTSSRPGWSGVLPTLTIRFHLWLHEH